MAIMNHAKFHFNQLMLTLIFGIWASEPFPPRGPGERLKRPGLIGLKQGGSKHRRRTSGIIVPDQIGTLSQVGTKKISKGGWTI